MQRKQFFDRLVRQYSVTYHLSSQLFPSAIRQEVFVLYAFLRLADELVDNPLREPAAALLELRKDWAATEAGRGRPARDWESLFRLFAQKKDIESIKTVILEEFRDLFARLQFEEEWIEAFFFSMGRDLSTENFADWNELDRYIYGSAEVVGLMMARVMGVEMKGGAGEAAQALGWAMQMTNFIRDIREDWERGRIYVPLSELKKFEIDVDEWGNPQNAAQEKKQDALLKHLIQITEKKYLLAIEGVINIPANCRVAVLTATLIYREVLRKISLRPITVWQINYQKTFWSAPKAIWQAYLISRQLRKKRRGVA